MRRRFAAELALPLARDPLIESVPMQRQVQEQGEEEDVSDSSEETVLVPFVAFFWLTILHSSLERLATLVTA